MKMQQCPTCGQKINLKLAVATKTANGILTLRCAHCKEWSHENRKATAAKNLGLLMLLTGSIMGYFQFGGMISGPAIALIGVLLALATVLIVPRVIITNNS